jgi:hypothetical protein
VAAVIFNVCYGDVSVDEGLSSKRGLCMARLQVEVSPGS